jgi:hypothetical protein
MFEWSKIFYLFSMLIAEAWAFPAIQTSNFVIPMPLTFQTVCNATIEVTSSGPIVYVPLLSNDQVTVTLYQVNMNTANGTMLTFGAYTLPQNSSSYPVVSLSTTQGYVSYRKASGAQYLTYNKTTLTGSPTFSNTSSLYRGFSLSNFGLYIYNEGV